MPTPLGVTASARVPCGGLSCECSPFQNVVSLCYQRGIVLVMVDTKVMSLRLPAELHARLADLAGRHRRSLNSQIVLMLEVAPSVGGLGEPPPFGVRPVELSSAEVDALGLRGPEVKGAGEERYPGVGDLVYEGTADGEPLTVEVFRPAPRPPRNLSSGTPKPKRSGGQAGVCDKTGLDRRHCLCPRCKGIS